MDIAQQEVKKVSTPPVVKGDARFPVVPPELAMLDGEVSSQEEEKLPTLAVVGKRLPLGYVDQTGNRHVDFELSEWNYELEEQLGELASQNQEMPMNVYVSEVIGHGLSRVGSIDVSKMKRSERRLLVRSMYFSDALYVYIWIRMGALGSELRLNVFACSSCGRKIEGFIGDLRTLEVRMSSGTVPTKNVKLEKGVTYAGKQLTEFIVGPVRWAFMETDDPTFLSNPARFKLVTIQQGVTGLVGAPEGPVYLTAEHLRTMPTREINVLVREIDQCGGGPVMEIRDACPKCRRGFRQPINWSYEGFFAPSSQ
jgi:hypothetical protein